MPNTRNGGNCHKNIYHLHCQPCSSARWREYYLSTPWIVQAIAVCWQGLLRGYAPLCRVGNIPLLPVGMLVALIGVVCRGGVIGLCRVFVGRRMTSRNSGSPL